MNNLVLKAMDEVRETVMNALGACVADGSLDAQPIPSFLVEIPADKSHGDFATNIAMVCARVFHKAPRQIAELVKSHMDLQGTYFASCEIAGPCPLISLSSDDRILTLIRVFPFSTRIKSVLHPKDLI